MALDLPYNIDVLNLKKPDKNGAPKQRLSDPGKTSAIVQSLLYANRERAQVDAVVKGMLDGNAPFSYADLRAKGQGQRTNVNFREAEAMMADAMTPFYDLFAESDTYCKVEVDETNPEKRADWSRIVTEKFDALMKEWAGFDWNMQAVLFDMVGYGKGFPMWADKTSWQFKCIRQSRVLVPDQTPSDVDQLELLVVRQSCNVSDMYKPIRDTERAKSIGWNTAAVLDACARAMPESTSNNDMDWELVQQELRNHDLYEMTRSSVVRIAHVFVKEFSDKITHLIIEESDGRTSANKPASDFLFKKIGRFDSFRQIISPLFYDIGDGTWHSIKGLMIKLHPFIQIKNRLNCSVVDNAFINMSVLVRPTTAQAKEDAAIVHLGPLSVLPPNVEVQQWGLTGRMEEGLAVEQSLTRKLESNLGQYRKPLLKEQGNPATATQVTYDAAKEAALNKGAVNRFYSQLDMLFEEIYRRASNPNLVSDNKGQNDAAMKFQQACIDAGVPKIRLQKPKFIRATRNIGNGSIFLRQQTVMQTAQFVPMFNEAGRQAWLDDAIAVMAGTEAVARWNPKQAASQGLQNEAAWAMMENAVLHVGGPVKWTQSQNNAVHGGVHLKAMMDAVNSLNPQNNGGGDPSQVIGFLDAAGPHVAIHIEQLKADPTQRQLYTLYSQQFEQIANTTQALKQRMQQAMTEQRRNAVKLQQRQQEVMTNGRLDEIELQNKLRMSQEKTDAMIRLKEQKQAQSLALSDASTASSISLQSQKARADAAIRASQATEE